MISKKEFRELIEQRMAELPCNERLLLLIEMREKWLTELIFEAKLMTDEEHMKCPVCGNIYPKNCFVTIEKLEENRDVRYWDINSDIDYIADVTYLITYMQCPGFSHVFEVNRQIKNVAHKRRIDF